MVHSRNKCINDTPNEIPCIFDSRKGVNFSNCATRTPAAPSERIGSIRTNVFMDENKEWLIERVNAGMGEHEYVISYLGDHFATVPSEVIAREIVEMQCHTCPVFTPEHDATIRNQTLDDVIRAIESKKTYEGDKEELFHITGLLCTIESLRSTQSTDSEATDR